MTAQTAQIKQPTLLGRAARMLLVFLLVFGMSFRVEMALAAGVPTSDLKGHTVGEDELTDLVVCKVVDDKVDTDKGVVRSLVDEAKEKKANKEDSDKGFTLEYDQTVVLAAAPKWGSKLDASAAKFVKWKVGDKESTDPTVTIKNDGKLGAEVKVTCTVSADAKDYLADNVADVTTISFPIKMTGDKVKSISQPKCVILLDGKPEGESNLDLTLDQGKSGYTFKAQVTGDIVTSDSITGDVISTDPFSYLSDSGTSLSDASGGLLGTLTWELLPQGNYPLDENSVKIDQDGRLTVEKDSAFLVQCKMTDAKGDPVVFPQVSVKCGNPKESDEPSDPTDPDEPGEIKADQGADNHQDSLHVTGRIATSAMKAGVNAAEESTSSSSSAQGEEGESSSSSSSEAAGSESSSEKKDEVTELDKTFSLSDIEALGSTQADFSVNSGAAGAITVTGEGPKLEALFKSMDIENLDGINELKFIDYAEGEVTVSWSALSGAIVAVKSYVHDPVSASEQESESTSSSSAEGDEKDTDEKTDEKATDSSENKTELLENTRFRVLADGLTAAGVDADSLRWVKEIVVNPGSKVEPEPEPEPESEPEAPFTVSVAYAPSPIGQEAVFWPIPSKEIAGATFDYTWEESSDNGQTWEKVSENPTYRTVTTKERIGHLFRVILSSNMKDEATGKDLKATSDPEPMVEGSGFSLIYDPPLAGGVAMFEVKLNGTISGLDINKLEYIWELSTDGCETWTKLADQYQGKSTLSIQTDPIDEKDSSNSDVTPVYIRARVIEKTGDKRAFVAGPQMLTVRTGEEAGDGDDKKGSPPEGAKPVSTVVDTPGKQQTSGGKKATADDDLEFIDDTDFGDDDDDGDGDEKDTKAPAENGTESAEQTSTPQLHINGEVTEKILEQEKAVQEQVAQTVPGARWTAINATQASGDDVRNVLADNPFAPFAIPVGLGITVAGGLEKLLAFRRQL